MSELSTTGLLEQVMSNQLRKFVMRKKPEKPKRRTETFTIWDYSSDGKSILYLLGALVGQIRGSDIGVDFGWVNEGALIKDWLHKIVIKQDYDNRDCCELTASINLPEPDRKYKARLDEFEKKLKEYNDWRKSNTAAIEAYEKDVKDRKARAEERRRKSVAELEIKRKARLEKELARTNEKLAKLNQENK